MSDTDGLTVILAILILIGLSFIEALFFWLLWNNIVILAITVTNPITYWQSFWLMVFITNFLKVTGGKKHE